MHQTFGTVNLRNHSLEIDYAFEIIDPKSNDQFAMDRRGELSLKQSLDRERTREYRFQVNLTSSNNEFETRSATVLIQVCPEIGFIVRIAGL